MHKRIILTLISLCFLLGNFYSQGKELIFRHITTESNLHHNAVNMFMQDHMGFIWIATESGLHRFDGIDFKIYLHNMLDSNSISGNSIYKIFQDKKKRIWVCSNQGVDIYNFNSENFLHVALRIPNSDSIVHRYYPPAGIEDKNGNIYISWGNRGIFKYDEKKCEFQEVKIVSLQGEPLALGNITNMFVDSRNVLWLCSQTKGLFSFHATTGRSVSYLQLIGKKGLNTGNILSISEDKWSRIHVGTNKGLFLFEPATGEFTLHKSFPDVNIWAINADKNGDLWYCTNGSGLIRTYNRELNYKVFKKEKNPSSLNDNNVQCFFEDLQGNYWVGTQRGGINYHLNNNAAVFKTLKHDPTISNSLENSSVTAIVENKQTKNIWIGTDGGGIHVYDPRSKKVKYVNIGLQGANKANESILSLYFDKEQTLWAGGFLTGLTRVKGNSTRFYRNNPADPRSLGHDDVRFIMEDSKENLWIATNGGGLNLFNKENQTFTQFTDETSPYLLSSKYTLQVYEDAYQNLWIGSYDGLSKIDLKTMLVKTYQAESNLVGDWVYSILQDSKKRLWVGTNMGLNLFDYNKGTFTNMTQKANLSNEMVCGILEDAESNLWISTYYGLMRFNPENGTSNAYFAYDGLPGNNFNHGATHKAEDGTLYFGSTNGLLYFDPSRIVKNNYVPPVYITGVDIASKLVPGVAASSEGKLVLKYNEATTVNVHYTALNFINPEKNNYSIKLEGIDKNWYKVGSQRTAVYTNLSPGKYLFRVKASNNDNVWNETGATLEIVVLPPIWKTIWAFIFYFIVLTSLIIYIWYLTLLRVRFRKDLEIEHIKAGKAEEMAKMKTEFFVNVSHELSTPLTLILPPVEKMMSKQIYDNRLMSMIRNNAHLLLRLVNELIDSQKLEEGKSVLNLSYNDIVSFSSQIVSNFSELAATKNIELQFKSSCTAFWFHFDVEKMEKILYNLISNAIKYTPDDGHVLIEISESPNESHNLQISVSDTGIGISEESKNLIFNRYYRVNQSGEQLSRATGFGIGLYLTHKLIELHNGKLDLESTQGKGSKFTVLFTAKKGEAGSLEQVEKTSEAISNKEYSIPEMVNNDNEESDFKTKKPIILVAEDNQQVCEMIRLLLEDKYQLHFTHNGNQGFRLAIRILPQLIITDIMMPEMDGIEFCSKIKNDFYTRHIPVIMLTALNSSEFMIKGLATGADDYISKPFNPEIFELRIKNMIESRIILQKRFFTDAKAKPSEVALNSADDIFLEKVVKIIEKNLETSDFDVNSLASDLNISAITLYRKLKSLTGQNINQFIRTVRLKRAAQLLEDKSMSVREISLMVGFNDMKYFRKCFQKQFGTNPSQYSESIDAD